MLIRRNARDHFSALKPYLEPKADPELRALALAGLDEEQLQTAAADTSLGLGVYRARLARGEREQAIDWFLARGAALPPNLQAEAMADWLAMGPPGTTENKPTAAKTVGAPLPREPRA